MGGTLSWVPAKLCTARAICLILLLHLVRAAASRTFWTAGRSRPMRTAMMAITTKSSIRVNAARPAGRADGTRLVMAAHSEGDPGGTAPKRPAGFTGVWDAGREVQRN